MKGRLDLHPTKQKKLLSLYDETFLHVTKTEQNFFNFLKQSSYLHEYSIDEQLCIHGQMPQAKFINEKEGLKWQIKHEYPARVKSLKETVAKLEEDKQLVESPTNQEFSITIDNQTFTERAKAAEKLDEICTLYKNTENFTEIGEYHGFTVEVRKNFHEYGNVDIRMVGQSNYIVTNALGNGLGGIRKMENELQRIPSYYADTVNKLEIVEDQFFKAKERQQGKFPQEKELKEKLALQAQLNQEIQTTLESEKTNTSGKEFEQPNLELEY
ncbi:hypothetical protein IET27_002720 [Enterococcus faecalis]|uniref:hypothetical protein n=1 Tax=Enterococcus faecalis TaxID=1351 RepID=UPI0011B033A0|nr:hypothetical protein [Enterococcus faecalis]EGO2635402.1 hypothetical protein [Enterococcus faecalis]EGO2657153.1 hypothetical protein [Enterococcus faecalis]EGO5091527.1 hypothetical protein [Enterococcus faecalis]EGO6786604.1 hypothetical protein [Enterococcus faecalis]EGO8200380.1 hypothetical protein [Enterococcus faecalis]